MAQQYGQDSGSPDRNAGATNAGADSNHELRAKTQQVGEQAKTQARDSLDQQKRSAADTLEHVAGSIGAAAERLQQDDESGLSHYVAGLAGNLGDFADGLRSKNVDDMMRDVRRMAQRNPALFLTGSVAMGFGLARFARASAQRDHGTADDRYASNGAGIGNYGGSTGYGATSASSAAAEGRAAASPYTAGGLAGSGTMSSPPVTGTSSAMGSSSTTPSSSTGGGTSPSGRSATTNKGGTQQ